MLKETIFNNLFRIIVQNISALFPVAYVFYHGGANEIALFGISLAIYNVAIMLLRFGLVNVFYDSRKSKNNRPVKLDLLYLKSCNLWGTFLTTVYGLFSLAAFFLYREDFEFLLILTPALFFLSLSEGWVSLAERDLRLKSLVRIDINSTVLTFLIVGIFLNLAFGVSPLEFYVCWLTVRNGIYFYLIKSYSNKKATYSAIYKFDRKAIRFLSSSLSRMKSLVYYSSFKSLSAVLEKSLLLYFFGAEQFSLYIFYERFVGRALSVVNSSLATLVNPAIKNSIVTGEYLLKLIKFKVVMMLLSAPFVLICFSVFRMLFEDFSREFIPQSNISDVQFYVTLSLFVTMGAIQTYSYGGAEFLKRKGKFNLIFYYSLLHFFVLFSGILLTSNWGLYFGIYLGPLMAVFVSAIIYHRVYQVYV